MVEKCSNCKYGSKNTREIGALECHLSPPSISISTPAGVMVIHPPVSADGWCGSWEAQVKSKTLGTDIEYLDQIEIREA